MGDRAKEIKRSCMEKKDLWYKYGFDDEMNFHLFAMSILSVCLLRANELEM